MYSMDTELENMIRVQLLTVNKPSTKVLDQSEISITTKQSAGLKHKKGQERPTSITAMICARERGMYGSTSFTQGDCCKIANTFLPNTSTVIGSPQAKIFCGTYLDNGNLFLCAGQDKYITLFDARGGNFKLLRTITVKDVGQSILDVAVSPEEKYIAYSGWSRHVQISNISGDAEDQESHLVCPEERRFAVFSLKFSADGNELLYGSNEGYLYVYDRQIQQRVCRILGHDNDVNAVAFADNRSQILYSGGDDGICNVWDRRTIRNSNPDPVGTLAGHMDGITYIEPQGDGRHLLTNSKDHSIKLWDVRKFSKVGLKITKIVGPVGQWDYSCCDVSSSLRSSKKKVRCDSSIMTYSGHIVLQTLCRCHFSPAETTGQRFIYAGCARGRVIVYDLLSGQPVKILTGHTSCVRDAAWHPHRNEIISTSWDGKIVKWTYREPEHDDSNTSNRGEDVEGYSDPFGYGRRSRRGIFF